MKIQAKKNTWTAVPEKFWEEGEVLDLPEDLAKQLLTNPNFVLKVEQEPEEGSKIKIKKKSIK